MVREIWIQFVFRTIFLNGKVGKENIMQILTPVKNKLADKRIRKLCVVTALVISPLILYRLTYHIYSFRQSVYPLEFNAVAFLLGYLALKRLDTLEVWKFVIYLVILTSVQLAFQSILDCDRMGHWILTYNWERHLWLLFWVIPFILSSITNYGLLKYLFKFDTRTSIIMSILMTMATGQVRTALCYF